MAYPPTTVQTVLPVLPIPEFCGRGLDWLRAMFVDPSVALSYLETIELHLKLRSLYQHFFPFEFRLSTASRHWEPDQHSEEELEFFDLIHERLFYLPIDGDENLCTGIPIYSIAPDFWYEEYEWEELDVLEQLLLGLSGQEEWGILEQTFLTVPLLNPVPSSRIDWNKFKLNCEAMPAPLNYFHLAIQMFDRETGNPFIDNHNYEYIDLWAWTVEAIEELTHHYHKAILLQQKAQILVDWLTDHPHRLIQLIDLWNRSAKTTPARPSIKIIQSSQLGQNWAVRRN
ncbi:hypothetical protein ACQ4M3_24675 [Leptolyngbya sp. AN03gr2]|uniref:hypothetical protein n=1 Tax=unclassified Leptolyngbya TaxID=2650499 RepID=UPI003D310F8C